MLKKFTTLLLAVILLLTVSGRNVQADETRYYLSDETDHGSVKFFIDGEEVSSAKAGDTVTLEVSKDSGYELIGVEAIYDDIYHKVKMTDGVYSFTMPAKGVYVDAMLYNTSLHMGENNIAQGGLDHAYYPFAPDKDNTYIFTATTDSPTIYDQYVAYIVFFEEKEDSYEEILRLEDITKGFSLKLCKDRNYYMYMTFLGYAGETKHVDINIAYGEYCVSFDTEGGTDVGPQYNAVGTVITRPDDPEKEGYQFVDWFEMITVGSNTEFVRYAFSVPESEDKTLYAKWVLQNHKDEKYGADVIVADRRDDEFADMDNYSDKTLVLEADNGVVIVSPGVHHSGHIWAMNSAYQPKVEGLEAFVDKAVEGTLTEFYLEIEKTAADANITEDCEAKGYEIIEGSFFDAHMMRSVQNGMPSRYPSEAETLTGVSLTITLDLSAEDMSFPEEKSGYRRSYYVAHYDGDKTEYLPLNLDANKEKGTFTTTSLSPFAIVYKDVKDTYIVPDTATK
ncbi:MAG: InlB B-repeat-containing protein [Erysipelotrichaceae bacterium]|nr:InlB B-repeat-containing protein [Erysipelotrichaceae bacterium]